MSSEPEEKYTTEGKLFAHLILSGVPPECAKTLFAFQIRSFESLSCVSKDILDQIGIRDALT